MLERKKRERYTMLAKAILSTVLLVILVACSSSGHSLSNAATSAAADDADAMPSSYSPAKVCYWNFAGGAAAHEGTALGSWLYTSNDGWCWTTMTFTNHHLPSTPGLDVTVAPSHGTVRIVEGGVGLMHIAYQPAGGFTGPDTFTVVASIAPSEIIYPFRVLVGRATAIDGHQIIIVDKEPPAKTMRSNEKVLVEDNSCPAGQIEEVIAARPARIYKCIPRPG